MSAAGYSQLDGVDPSECVALIAGVGANGDGWGGPAPCLEDPDGGAYHFADFPDFCPNIAPRDVLRMGSFGGGYFRPIVSAACGGVRYADVWKELPEEWLAGLDVATQVASETYDARVNKFRRGCGAKVSAKTDPFGQLYWEQKGWIAQQDPYGWFQWYCRFFQGRRSADDRRQVDRWKRVAGEKGRWKSNLIGKVLRAGKKFDDPTVSPVVRQTLQHWGYELSQGDFKAGAQRVRERGAAYMPRSQLKGIFVGRTGTEQEKEKGKKSMTTAPKRRTKKKAAGVKVSTLAASAPASARSNNKRKRSRGGRASSNSRRRRPSGVAEVLLS